MATQIRPIPVLTGKAAKNFVEQAEYVEKNKRASIDFRKQAKVAKKILAKSQVKGKQVNN